MHPHVKQHVLKALMKAMDEVSAGKLGKKKASPSPSPENAADAAPLAPPHESMLGAPPAPTVPSPSPSPEDLADGGIDDATEQFPGKKPNPFKKHRA